MKNVTNIIFDLDGTISDSREGILNAFKFALGKMDVNVSYDNIERHIGAPLHETFARQFFKDQPEKVAPAVHHFRDYYRSRGKFENRMYDGIPELLSTLFRSYSLYVLTNKPQIFAFEILEHFALHQYFKGIYGLDENASGNKETISFKLNQTVLKGSTENTLMIGDTVFDLLCAEKAGWDFCFASYGFGTAGSLQPHVPRFTIHSPQQLKNLLCREPAL